MARQAAEMKAMENCVGAKRAARVLSKPKVALVGTGGFGRHHFAALRTLERIGECRIVAICDNGQDALQSEETDGTFGQYSALADLLEGEHLDHIVLSTPPHLHREQACSVLERGISLYLEKPPVTTIGDLAKLRVFQGVPITVGFQLLEAPCMQSLKRELLKTGIGSVRRISAAGLWPRSTWYYQRSPWAGRMISDGRIVFDGPLTNAFAHLVHAVFYLLGSTHDTFAMPGEVRARLLRARPIESYDFGRIEGFTTDGIPFEIAAAHCATEPIPWTITIEMQDGRRLVVDESQIPSPSNDLLIACHRSAFAVLRGESHPLTRLEDCAGYVGATCAALDSSQGIHDIPLGVSVKGENKDWVYHSPEVLAFVREAVSRGRFPLETPAWLAPGKLTRCPPHPFVEL